MKRVYVLMKHPPYTYNSKLHIAAGEIVGIWTERTEPDRIAAEKNSRNTCFLYSVQAKQVKEPKQ